MNTQQENTKVKTKYNNKTQQLHRSMLQPLQHCNSKKRKQTQQNNNHIPKRGN